MCRDTCEAMKVKLKNAAILIILSTGSENITEAAQGISCNASLWQLLLLLFLYCFRSEDRTTWLRKLRFF